MPRLLSQFLDYYASDFENDSYRSAFNALFLLTLFLSFCGVIFLAVGVLPAEWSWTASLIIMLNGTAVFFSELRAQPLWRSLTVFTVIAGVTFLIEYVGVNTAFPFGQYAYSHVLWPQLAGVPLAIAFAWYSTIMTTRRIAELIHGNTSFLRIAVTAGVLVLALDIALEPMASFINNYWTWENDTIPVANYISWFMIGTCAVLALCNIDKDRQRQKERSRRVVRASVTLFFVQLFVFVVTDIAHGHTRPAVLALLLVAAAFVSRTSFKLSVNNERLLEK